MESSNLSPQNSLQIILLDNSNIMNNYNSYIKEVKGKIYILLVDENDKVIESRNPFIDIEAMLIYKQTDLKYKSVFKVSAIQPQEQPKKPELLNIVTKKIPPFIILNEEASTVDELMKVIGSITRYEYYCGASAIMLYGNNGKNGVLKVSTYSNPSK
jgi:hypothetical protein